MDIIGQALRSAGPRRRSPTNGLALLLAIVPAVAGVLASAGETPAVTTIMRKMQAVSIPDRPSVRRMKIHVSTSKGDVTAWEIVEARKKLADGIRRLIVILDPRDAKGTAYLIAEETDQLWVYLPQLRRARKLSEINRYEPLLNSDFSLGDFGLGVSNPTYKLLGTAKLDGVDCFQVEETSDETWHYSRVVDWVAQDSFQRLQRDFYDVAGRLWKVERFEKITTVDGAPIPLQIRMEDQQRGASTVIDVVAVKLDTEIPSSLLESAQLPSAADSRVWSSVRTFE